MAKTQKRKKKTPAEPLNSEERIFVITHLAAYDTPQEVADLFQEAFGRTISRQCAAAYDASKPWARKGMAKKWVALFDMTRQMVDQQAPEVPIAKRHVRMKRLERLYHSTRSLEHKMAILKQAAQEQGGAFTNHRTLSAPGGGPIGVQQMHFVIPHNGRPNPGSEERMIGHDEAKQLVDKRFPRVTVKDEEVEEAKVLEEVEARKKEVKKDVEEARKRYKQGRPKKGGRKALREELGDEA